MSFKDRPVATLEFCGFAKTYLRDSLKYRTKNGGLGSIFIDQITHIETHPRIEVTQVYLTSGIRYDITGMDNS